MSTPETIRADAREDERYNRDGPLAEQPCDPDWCAPYVCEEIDKDKQGPLFGHEVDRDGADIMVYCTCDHHGADIEKRASWAAGMTYYDTRHPAYRTGEGGN